MAVIVLFLGWRFVRPLNIFVVEEKFAWPIDSPIPKGLESLSAQHCGSCHTEIYQEWSGSMHARAWTDEYYQADRAFEKRPHVCINCHIPLKNQQEKVVVRYRDKDMLDPVLADNPHFDPQLRDEGVTCAVCHVRQGEVIGPYATDQSPHPVKVDPNFLSGMSPCRICHVVSGDRWDMFYRIAPCGTVDEINQGERKPDCVGCHLPSVTRPMATSGPLRQGGRHLFQGGHYPPQVARALKVDHRREEVDGKSQFVFTLTNVGTDHFLPTGTPDRHLTLAFRLLDDHDAVMQEKVYKLQRTIMWRPFILDLWDNRLAARQPREFIYELPKMGAAPQAAVLDVTIRYHLLDEARRKRINYQNTVPIHYSIYHERIDLSGGT
ncbi:MAG: hypothetical protein HQL62_02810 [Magnetococcales bacterium]|nr:hypothetical protein [Magnetococcales bacterium]